MPLSCPASPSYCDPQPQDPTFLAEDPYASSVVTIAIPQLMLDPTKQKTSAKITMLAERVLALYDKADATLGRGDDVTHEWCKRFALLQADLLNLSAAREGQKQGVFHRLKRHVCHGDDLQAIADLTDRIDDLFLALLFGRKVADATSHCSGSTTASPY